MNEIQNSWIDIDLNYLSGFFWKKQNITYIRKKHINTTSLIYERNIYRHYIDYIYIYIYIKEIPTYTTSRIYIRETHTGIATYILYHIYIEEVHTDTTTLTGATETYTAIQV